MTEMTGNPTSIVWVLPAWCLFRSASMETPPRHPRSSFFSVTVAASHIGRKHVGGPGGRPAQLSYVAGINWKKRRRRGDVVDGRWIMAADSRPGQSRHVLWCDSLRRVPQDDSSQSWSTHGIVRARQLAVISTYLLPSRRDRIDAEGSGHFLLGHSFPRGRGGHHYLKVVDHPRSGVVYDFDDVRLSVCLSVCQTITFESLDVRRSFSHTRSISSECG